MSPPRRPRGSIEIRYEDENIWLTQKTMAQLYDECQTINYHIKKIFDDSELSGSSYPKISDNCHRRQTVRCQLCPADDHRGRLRQLRRAFGFRKWVNQIATQYTIRGWVMDDERLKQGTYLTDKCFG
ncbi:MAG: hypothetical protein ACLS7Z_03680 [Christensenellales bacterium]